MIKKKLLPKIFKDKGENEMSGVAISFVTGSGALDHNNRKYIHDNVDPNRIKDNINYKEESLEKAYEKCFGNSVEEYNQKQTRNDRKIKNYMKQIKDSGNNEKLFYENIIQVGDKYSHGFGSGNEKQAIDILNKYAKEFQERNSNLYVFNMKMHLDEASPHLHIDYILVAKGYKRGLETRNSLTKAHQNMGIAKGTGRNDNSTMKWQERGKKYIKEIAKDHNLEIINKNTDRKHLTVEEYKIYADKIEKQYDKVVDLKANINAKDSLIGSKKVLEKKDFDRLVLNAKYNSITNNALKPLIKDIEGKKSELNFMADNLKKRDNILKVRTQEVDSKIEKVYELKDKYENLYKQQLNINEKVEFLERKIESLEIENTKIQPLQDKVENLAYVVTNQIKAINLFLHDEDDYALNMPKKQINLIKALDNYTQGWLKQIGREDLAEEVSTKMGISKGIQDNIKELNKSKDRGARQID